MKTGFSDSGIQGFFSGVSYAGPIAVENRGGTSYNNVTVRFSCGHRRSGEEAGRSYEISQIRSICGDDCLCLKSYRMQHS